MSLLLFPQQPVEPGVIGVWQGHNDTTGALTVAIPSTAGIQAGDILVALGGYNNATAPTNLTGWTAWDRQTPGASGASGVLATRTADGTENGTNIVLDAATHGRDVLVIMAIRGAPGGGTLTADLHPANTLDTVGGTSTVASPTGTTAQANELVLNLFVGRGISGTNVFTEPSGETLVQESGTLAASVNIGAAIARDPHASTGSVGGLQLTNAISMSGSVAWTLSFYTAVGSTPKTGTTETSSGTDASTLKTALPRTDSGSGSDASTEKVALPRTDSASGADASIEKAALPRTDSGSGTDASHSYRNRTDTGSGADASTEKASYPRTDAATGADASKSIRSRVDSATGADVSTEKVVLSRTDTGTGADTSLSLRKVTDSAIGADASVEKVVLARTDTGTGADASRNLRNRTDSATGSEASTLRVSLPRTESGIGTDLSGERDAVPVTDTAHGTDASTEKATYARTDSGTGTDASSIKVPVSATDSATGTDASHGYRNRTDSAAGSDASTERVALARTDAGTSSDASRSLRKGTDSGTGVESSALRTKFAISDSAVGSDASSERTVIARTDAGSGADASTEHAVYGRTDSATGADAGSVPPPPAAYIRNLRSTGDFQELTSVNHITYTTLLSVAAGNSIIVPVMLASGSISSITDNSGLGLTWVIDKASAPSVYAAIARAYCPGGLPSGTQVTVNFSGTPAWSSLSLHEVSIANASPEASGSNSGTGASWSVTASGATTDPGTLTIAAFAQSGTSSPSAGSGYTDLLTGTQDHFGLEYKANAATGTFTANENSSGTPNWAAVMVAYGAPVTATLKSGTDSGSGADASSLKVLEARTDSATGTDASILRLTKAVSDSASGIDVGTLKVALSRSDSATGADNGSLSRLISKTDSGTGTDSSSQRAHLAASESATAVDAVFAHVAKVTGTDIATGADRANLLAQLLRTDHGIGADTSTKQAPGVNKIRYESPRVIVDPIRGVFLLDPNVIEVENVLEGVASHGIILPDTPSVDLDDGHAIILEDETEICL